MNFKSHIIFLVYGHEAISSINPNPTPKKPKDSIFHYPTHQKTCKAPNFQSQSN
jgi:hypothetical protein